MNHVHLTIALLALYANGGVLSSGPPDQVVSALAGYDFRAEDARHLELQGRLAEVSGLALDARGRLWAHDDERATVYRIGMADGRVEGSFDIGRNGARGDLEGIAIAGSRFFLITSDGKLVEAAEGEDGETVEFTNLDIESRDVCAEIEGLEYDPAANALLLACKAPKGRALRDRIVVLRFSLRTRTLDAEPLFAIPVGALEAFGLDARFSPSGIAIHPVTGTILVIAARERAIMEIDREGLIVAAAPLRASFHEQAEGIAIARDGTLIIADEAAGGGNATLTFLAYRPGAGGQ